MPVSRKIVRIDEEKCNGCGLCVDACHEGAIQLVNGKARLVSETYCDGLGDCLGKCPVDAITVDERVAAPYDEKATQEHLKRLKHAAASGSAHRQDTGHKDKLPCGCPGTMARQIKREPAPAQTDVAAPAASELTNWPVQLKLVSTQAPYFQNADLLLVADCVPFALADFHRRFLNGRPVVIGCPKLDDPEFYVEKLTALLTDSDVRSLTVLHMEVPCCSALTRIAQAAMEACGKEIPFREVVIGIGGEVLSEEEAVR